MTKGDKEVDRKHTVLDILSLLSLLSLVSYSLLSLLLIIIIAYSIYIQDTPVFVADSKLLLVLFKTSIIQISTKMHYNFSIRQYRKVSNVNMV